MASRSSALSITSKGQITLKKDLLNHLGIEPGDKVDVVMAPGGKLLVTPARVKKPMSALLNLLPPYAGPPVTDEQIEAGIARGAVEEYLAGLPEKPSRKKSAA
ncbi:MAG: AbrB/MazE/SpoVT family DNA-binding domain-containing protein [Brevundimonas sp.]|nr:AbrB/MazE/SpoVT family DNA-binding domain-containing protein [Brevundimonas sp.]